MIAEVLVSPQVIREVAETVFAQSLSADINSSCRRRPQGDSLQDIEDFTLLTNIAGRHVDKVLHITEEDDYFERFTDTAKGSYSRRNNIIYIRDSLTTLEKFGTLSHELCHALEPDDYIRRSFDRFAVECRVEIAAETIRRLFFNRISYEPDSYSMIYIAKTFMYTG